MPYGRLARSKIAKPYSRAGHRLGRRKVAVVTPSPSSRPARALRKTRSAYGALTRFRRRRGGGFRAGFSKLNHKVKCISSGTSFSRFAKIYKMSKPAYDLVKDTSVNTLLTNQVQRLTCSTGIQAIWEYPILNYSQIHNLSTYINTESGTGTYQSNTKKWLLKSMQSKITFTNTDNGNVFVDAYFLTARQDSTQDPSTAWNVGLQHAAGTNTGNFYQDLGAVPFSSPDFCQFWKVDKIHHIELEQGRSHCILDDFQPNYMVQQARVEDTNGYMRGLSRYIMFVAWGAPCNDQTTTTNISTGSVTLDFVSIINQTYYWAADPASSFNVTTNTGNINTQTVLNIGSGAVGTHSAA